MALQGNKAAANDIITILNTNYGADCNGQLPYFADQTVVGQSTAVSETTAAGVATAGPGAIKTPSVVAASAPQSVTRTAAEPAALPATGIPDLLPQLGLLAIGLAGAGAGIWLRLRRR